MTLRVVRSATGQITEQEVSESDITVAPPGYSIMEGTYYKSIAKDAPCLPYDALVCVDGSEILTHDACGAELSSAALGADDSSELAAAAALGTVFLKKFSGSYTLDTKIPVPVNGCIDSDGAQLDVTGLDDIVFDFAEGYPTAKRQFIRNITATGLGTNTNTMLCRFQNNPYEVRAENLHGVNLCNFIHILGNCYLARIDNCHTSGPISGGVPIKLAGSARYPAFGPNGAALTDVSIQSSDAVASPLTILDAADVIIHGLWIEGVFANGIQIERSKCHIDGGVLSHVGNASFVSSVVRIRDAYIRSWTPIVNGGSLTLSDCNIDHAGLVYTAHVAGNANYINIHDNEIKANGSTPVIYLSSGVNIKSLKLHHNAIAGGNSERGGLIISMPSDSSIDRFMMDRNDCSNMGFDGADFIKVYPGRNIIEANIFDDVLMGETGHLIKSFGGTVFKSNIIDNCTGLYQFNEADETDTI
jgi:hypothetical protein